MSEEKIKFISNFIDGYSGYLSGDDLERVSQYVSEKAIRLKNVLLRLLAYAPPDVSSYFKMSSEILDDILKKLSIQHGTDKISNDIVANLVEKDYKIVEIIDKIFRIVDSLAGGVPYPLYREYASMIYNLVARLRTLIIEKSSILMYNKYDRGLGI